VGATVCVYLCACTCTCSCARACACVSVRVWTSERARACVRMRVCAVGHCVSCGHYVSREALDTGVVLASQRPQRLPVSRPVSYSARGQPTRVSANLAAGGGAAASSPWPCASQARHGGPNPNRGGELPPGRDSAVRRARLSLGGCEALAAVEVLHRSFNRMKHRTLSSPPPTATDTNQAQSRPQNASSDGPKCPSTSCESQVLASSADVTRRER
jgi:hypothetical protein